MKALADLSYNKEVAIEHLGQQQLVAPRPISAAGVEQEQHDLPDRAQSPQDVILLHYMFVS